MGGKGKEAGAREIVLAGEVLSEITPRSVEWLNFGRLAYGKLTMMDGEGGSGKSTIATDAAACVTTAREPFGGSGSISPTNVIIVAPEDDAADTVRPRIEAAGGDARRVRVLNSVPYRDGPGTRALTLPTDVAYLRVALEHDNAHLIILDPIMSLFDPHVDTHKDASVRTALRPLLELLGDLRVACIAIRHVPKHVSDRAAQRGIGSVAFSNLARVVLNVGEHPWDLDRRVMCAAKSNLGGLAPTLSFEMRDTPWQGIQRIAWDPQPFPVGADALAALSANPERGQVLRVLMEYSRPLTSQEIAHTLGYGPDYSGLRHLLIRMLRDELIVSPQAGYYSLPHFSRYFTSHTSHASHASHVTEPGREIIMPGSVTCDVKTRVEPQNAPEPCNEAPSNVILAHVNHVTGNANTLNGHQPDAVQDLLEEETQHGVNG